MSWLNGLSREERDEMYTDNCQAYEQGVIGLIEFTACLAKLGYNATEIAELEKQFRPSPPEEDMEP